MERERRPGLKTHERRRVYYDGATGLPTYDPPEVQRAKAAAKTANALHQYALDNRARDYAQREIDRAVQLAHANEIGVTLSTVDTSTLTVEQAKRVFNDIVTDYKQRSGK